MYRGEPKATTVLGVGCFVILANIAFFLASVAVVAYAIKWVLRSA